MAWNQAQLEALEAALMSGVTSVSYEGKSVTYRSIAEMLQLRGAMRRALGLDRGSSLLVAAHDRGVTPTRGDAE